MKTIDTDVAIIGGSMGSVAAARALLARGYRVAITEEYAWIGGQLTSQAMCVPDEYHDPIFEGGGATKAYFEFRDQLRHFYTSRYKLSAIGRSQIHFSPTGGPKPMAAEPHVALEVIMDGFGQALESGQLSIHTGYVPTDAHCEGKRVESVTCASINDAKDHLELKARFFLSGDETGELYPFLPVGFRQGTESREEFGEPHAPDEADPESLQSFTFVIAAEYVPGGDFTIPKPADYDQWKERHGQWFYLCAPGANKHEAARMFTIRTGRGGIRIKPAFYYRSMIEKELFEDPNMPHSRTIFNINANDYDYANFVGHSTEEKAAILDDARGLALAYLYWLQTEAPRDDGEALGYPELRPLPEITGAKFGLAMAPYIREGRRLKACRTVVEQDLSTACQKGARAEPFSDSVGVGCFLIDIHKRVGFEGISQMSRPYQIPLGSLVCDQLDNFAVAGKGLGVTQIANGAYRLHPVEWNIGQAAGELAAYCLGKDLGHPRLQGRELFNFQRLLLREGFTLYWYEDFPIDHPGFEAVQILSLKGIWPGHPLNLRFNPNYSIVRSVKLFNFVMDRLAAGGVPLEGIRERLERSVCTRLYDVAHQIMCHLDEVGWPDFVYEPNAPILHREDWEIFNDLIPEPMDESELPGQLSKLG